MTNAGIAFIVATMGRPASLSLQGWFRQLGNLDRPWIADAKCGEHPYLPWIDDTTPTPMESLVMAEVCHECPVKAQCAGYGLSAAGGFYAGVWLPWRQVGNESDNTRTVRAWGRRQLRRIADTLELAQA